MKNITIPESLIDLIKKNPLPKLEEEITDFYFVNPDKLVEVQKDYRIDYMTGQDITGNDEGMWKKTWITIGSGVAEDPIFVDLKEEIHGYPVYTATNDDGEWLPYKVSNSVESFVKILEILNKMVKSQQFDGEIFLNHIEKYTDTKGVWEEEVEVLNEILLDDMNNLLYDESE